MGSQIKRLALLGSILILLCVVLFIINQTAQAVTLAGTINPTFGKIVLIGLLATFGAIITIPVVMIASMRASIQPPVDPLSSDYQKYLQRLAARLRKNPYVPAKHIQVGDRAGIAATLTILDAHVNGIIKKTASSLFVSTAISQNGRLDALMVLTAQSQMIWQIARVYNQRPSLRDMIQLYGNVGATVFAASKIEDLDISETIDPVIKAALGSSLGGSLGSLVGLGHIVSILTKSMMDGTANAYLTLRVGVLCRTYCGSLAAFDSKNASRYANATAALMLGSIVGESAGTVARAILAACKRAGLSTIESTTASIRGAGQRLNPFKKEYKQDTGH